MRYLQKIKRGSTSLARRSSQAFFKASLSAERVWTGDILVADAEELHYVDASEIYVRKLNATEVLVPKYGEKCIFPCADGTVKLAGKDHEVRTPTHKRIPPDQGEEHHDVLHGEADRSDPAEQQRPNDLEARVEFWSIKARQCTKN